MSVLDLFCQIPVRGGNHPHVHLRGFRISYFNKFTSLQNTQQLRLQIKRHFPDLIQEYGAVIRLFKQSLFVLQSARERTRFMSKHLALQQFLAESRTIHRHERLLGPFAIPVNRLRKHLFPRSGFSRQ